MIEVTIKLIHSDESYDECKVIDSTAVTLSEALEACEKALRGVGYCFEGHIEI